MSINDWYELAKFIINKNQQGYLSPASFNRVINQGQTAYQSFLVGSFQTYSAGRPVAKVELGQNSVVRQRLSPTIYGYTLHIDTAGYSPYPGDYIQTDAMWGIYGSNIYGLALSIYGRKRIRYSQQHQLDSYYNSVIDPVRASPIYLIEDTGFQFHPEDIGVARLNYVRDAPEIKWAYTLDGNGRPVYDPINSIQPVWDNISMTEILVRALLMVGVNLQSSHITAYSNEMKNQGQ